MHFAISFSQTDASVNLSTRNVRGEKEQSARIGSRFPPRRYTSGLIARDPELWSTRIVQYVRIQPGWEESRAENRVAEEAKRQGRRRIFTQYWPLSRPFSEPCYFAGVIY